MPDLLSTTLAIAVLATIAVVARREHAAAVAARRSLLDDCLHVLDQGRIAHGPDGLPSLKGRTSLGEVRVGLILDTMTIRRLPQLWLSTTLLRPMPHVAGFAVLVRPAGTEFYSLTEAFAHRMEAPVGFPAEVLVRGETGDSAALLARLAPQITIILQDPKVKEIAVTTRGLRIVRQAGEGERGAHLILRQARFDEARVLPRHLENILESLCHLSSAARQHSKEPQAA